MCDTCGCNVTPGNRHLVEGDGHLARTEDGRATVSVLKGLLAENDREAAHNRAHFDAHRVLAINLMSSPGAGKTALLEATLQALKGRLRVAVIEGDLETENDANRIRAQGVPAVQITTGSACHLDAHMVHRALHDLALEPLDLLFIENVGNLVCPASFDLGQHLNVTLLSVTEGDDKPAKYPVMFRAADLVLLTKTDLLAVLDDFSPERAEQHLRALASEAPVLALSARRGPGLDAWLDWLEAQLAAHRARLAGGETRRPAVQPDGVHLHEAPEPGRFRPLPARAAGQPPGATPGPAVRAGG
jgi:hydrogenase nickel incorporation protein HypB